MTDSYGRIIDYLRVSVTDRCNLRCVYCMPPTGVTWTGHAQILSFEEILRLCAVLAEQGIRKVKVTGGEPLVRKGTVDLIRRLKQVEGIAQVTLTSNGVLLAEYLDELIHAGLDALNVSLDTLDSAAFIRITGSEGLEQVLSVIDCAAARGLRVKVNCVPVRGLNDTGLMQIAALAREKDIAVRFIELMPVGCAASFVPILADEVYAMLEREYGALIPCAERQGNGPASYYAVAGFRGKLGFISAVSHEFCQSCNRLRLSSGGLLKPCLADDSGLDVKTLMRSGASDQQIKDAVQGLLAAKPLRHNFAGAQQADGCQKGMFRIGG